MTDYLADLNEAQRSAVVHGRGPLLVFAGAGSGKTRVLTRRIAHLVAERGVHPTQIFAVTFTNKAAAEMRQRVAALLPGKLIDIWVATFHSSCARILRRHARALDFNPWFTIYDTNDSLGALRRVYKKLKFDPKRFDPRSALHFIDRAKNYYLQPEEIGAIGSIPQPFLEPLIEIFSAYQAELKHSNAMDFGDLLCNVVTLFKLEPVILERHREQFQHLLVDEYQDTNPVQYLLIKLLGQEHGNVCVVGDDDQAIYGFRGATIENIQHFRRDFPGCKTITLDLNYRSTANILAAANSIIAKNQAREPKSMRTPNQAGSSVCCFRADDEEEEAQFVAREIRVLLSQGSSPAEISIFYRTNSQSRAFEEVLRDSGIRYEIFGVHPFYDRKEIKDALAYLRLLLNEDDNEAFLRVVNEPSRGLGANSVGGLAAFAAQQKISCIAALRKALNSTEPASFLTTANRKRFKSFLELIEELKERFNRAEQICSTAAASGARGDLIAAGEALPELLEAILERSGYYAVLKHEDNEEAQSRLENLAELVAVASSFSERTASEGKSFSIGDFLDRASLSADPDEEGAEDVGASDQAVSLMTLHLAKGLEFDSVFLTGLEEGLLPHVRSLDDRSGIEEERRLCYVGITRARKTLYLTRAASRRSFGRWSYYSGEPSRFIFDLPENIVEHRGVNFLSYY